MPMRDFLLGILKWALRQLGESVVENYGSEVMGVPSVVLAGPAREGIVVHDEHARALASAALPVKVRLGRLPPRPEAQRRLVHLEDYFAPARGTAPPASTNWRAKAAVALARMYLNDLRGCCVISGKAHGLGVWSANDPDSGGIVQATDQEIDSQYVGICVITDVFDYMVRTGLVAGGKRYTLDGYAAVNWANKLLVQTVQVMGGASTIGIDLPEEWTRAAVWRVTSSQIVGGHDVTPIDYDGQGVYISSWGRVYLIEWPAFLSTRWVREMYYLAAPLWYGPDRLAPNGIDAARLDAALAAFRSGGIPDIGPGPVPPPPGPPPPPAPPTQPPLGYLTFDRNVPIGGTVKFQSKFAIPRGRHAVMPTGFSQDPAHSEGADEGLEEYPVESSEH
jgi:hypothetical protein